MGDINSSTSTNSQMTISIEALIKLTNNVSKVG